MKENKYDAFSNISINDLPIKFLISNVIENYPKILKTNEISTLEDLFLAYDNGVFNDGRKTGYKSLCGITEILKNLYLDATSIIHENLKFSPVIDINECFDNETTSKLSRLGITIGEQQILKKYYVEKYKIWNILHNNTLIDVMNCFYKDSQYQTNLLFKINERHVSWKQHNLSELQNLNFKIAVLTNDYTKKQHSNLKEDVLECLSDQLFSLKLIRNTILTQIENVENQMEEVNKVKSK